MSHSIWIELDSQNIHVNACNDIINEIREINKWVDKSIANENEKLIKDAQKIIEYIQATKKLLIMLSTYHFLQEWTL